jgi:hypothetical protein
MKTGLSLLLVACAASAATAASAPGDNPARSTVKPTDEFVACFSGVQQRAALPWSYVPHENGGGTFSNAGAAGVKTPYFLDVADRGSRREIRLEAASAPSRVDQAIMSAVDRCI